LLKNEQKFIRNAPKVTNGHLKCQNFSGGDIPGLPFKGRPRLTREKGEEGRGEEEGERRGGERRGRREREGEREERGPKTLVHPPPAIPGSAPGLLQANRIVVSRLSSIQTLLQPYATN
jgi:hypothetical protein